MDDSEHTAKGKKSSERLRAVHIPQPLRVLGDEGGGLLGVVGALIAVTFTSAVDSPERFAKSRSLGAHFGLTPRKYQSGQMHITGAVSDAGLRNTGCLLPRPEGGQASAVTA